MRRPVTTAPAELLLVGQGRPASTAAPPEEHVRSSDDTLDDT